MSAHARDEKTRYSSDQVYDGTRRMDDAEALRHLEQMKALRDKLKERRAARDAAPKA